MGVGTPRGQVQCHSSGHSAARARVTGETERRRILCAVTVWDGMKGANDHLQRHHECHLSSLPQPLAPLRQHPGGPLPSHSPQTQHVKLIPALELVPGGSQAVSSPADAPGGRKLTSRGGGWVPSRMSRRTTQLRPTVPHSCTKDAGSSC